MTQSTNERISSVTLVANRLTSLVEQHWLAFMNVGLGIWTLTPWLAPVFMHWGWTGPGRLIYAIYSLFCHQLPTRSWFFFGRRFTYSLAEITAVWPEPATFLGLRGFIGNPEMGWKLGWSDRMVSFYGGFFLFGVLYALARGVVRRRGFWVSWKWLIILLLPITVDGVSHMISDLYGIGQGFRDTNAWLAILTGNALPTTFYAGDAWGSFNSIMRLITGLLGSFALIFWAYPIIDGVHHSKWRSVRSTTVPHAMIGHNKW